MPALLLVHIGAGSLAILSGAVAVCVRKGGRLHRAFGTAFFVCMLIMSSIGAYLAVRLPQTASLIVGILTGYLVATGWATVRRAPACIGRFEKAAFGVALGSAVALASLGVQAANSATGLLDGAPPARYYAFAVFAAFAAAMDLNMILRGRLAGAHRLARHLWRMCFALFFATSFFFLGQQKAMPVFLRGSPLLFVPAMAPLLLLIVWLIRVRFTRWRRREAPDSPTR